MISDKADNKLEPGDTITVKSFKEKDEKMYEVFGDKEVTMMKEEIGRLTERVVRMEHHTHQHK